MVQEAQVTTNDLIFPLFLLEGTNKKVEVKSMPGIYRFSMDLMLHEIESCLKLGIKAFDIFPAVEDTHKDKLATKSYDSNFFYLKALKRVSSRMWQWTLTARTAMMGS
jgi:porphobilinogen synthase